jgi:hypothetical protein
VKYEEAVHKPLGLVLFGAYVLGSASSVAGEAAARQHAAKLLAGQRHMQQGAAVGAQHWNALCVLQQYEIQK